MKNKSTGKKSSDSKNKLMVNKKIPYENLSPFSKLAVDHCNGDLVEAFLYMHENLDDETQEAYTENLSPKESEACVNGLSLLIKRNNLEDELDRVLDLEYALAHLHMTEEQVMAAEKNPFVPKLWASIGALAFACVVDGVVAGLGERFIQDKSSVETVAIVLGGGSTFLAYKVWTMLVNSFRFRKVKRLLEKDTPEE